jgi:hypothetical protein
VAIFGFKAGVTVFDQAQMNSLLSAQPTSLIFDGTYVDGNSGSGVYENNISTMTLMSRFKLTGQTTIGRIEFDHKKIGNGADVTIEIRDNTVNTDGSNDGVLLKSITFPKEIFGTGYISLPIDLSGLTQDAYYWIVIKKNGDAANHIRWIGETSQDANHPSFSRSGSSGPWSANNVPHFKVYAATPGSYRLIHGVYGSNAKTIVFYDAQEKIAFVWRWLTAADGSFVIVDKMTPVYDENGMIKGLEVT